MNRKYSGVAFNKKEGKWKARYVKSDGKRVWLKSLFDSEEEAARAYDEAVLKDGNPAQPLNFASRDSSSSSLSPSHPLTTPTSSAAADPAPVPPTSAPEAESKPVSTDYKPTKQEQGKSDEKEAVNEGEGDDAEDSNRQNTKPSAKRKAPTQVAEGSEAEKEPRKRVKRKTFKELMMSKLDREMEEKEKQQDPMDTEQQQQAAQTFYTVEGSNLQATFPLRFVPVEDQSSLAGGVIEPFMRAVKLMYGLKNFHKMYKPMIETIDKNMQDWCLTLKEGDEEVTDSSNAIETQQVYALDCEMVICKRRDGKGGPISTLARVSLLRWKQGDKKEEELQTATVLDQFVKVPADLEVIDYVTDISGVTKEHLDGASLDLQQVRQDLLSILKPWDLLVGHSLVADFTALRFWHGNFLDSSLLCSVRVAPALTLGLKDLALVLFEEAGEYADFQKDGESHDSVTDALWSLKCVKRILDLQADKEPFIPYLIDQIPERFGSRLTFHLVPEGYTDKQIRALIATLVEGASKATKASEPISFQAKPLKWSLRKDGSTVGSSIVEFLSGEIAKLVFNHLKTASKGCGGYVKSGACFRQGWPDRQGMQRKLIEIPPPAGKNIDKKKHGKHTCWTCEVTSFFPISLGYRQTVKISASVFGLVLGKHGRTLLMLQQVTGTRITIAKQPDRSNPSAGQGEFLVEAPSIVQLKASVALLQKASNKELKL